MPEIALLQSAVEAGFQAYATEGSMGGSAPNGRVADLVRQGDNGRTWELFLVDNGFLIARHVVLGFEPAGAAVLAWLHGTSLGAVVSTLGDALVNQASMAEQLEKPSRHGVDDNPYKSPEAVEWPRSPAIVDHRKNARIRRYVWILVFFLSVAVVVLTRMVPARMERWNDEQDRSWNEQMRRLNDPTSAKIGTQLGES